MSVICKVCGEDLRTVYFDHDGCGRTSRCPMDGRSAWDRLSPTMKVVAAVGFLALIVLPPVVALFRVLP